MPIVPDPANFPSASQKGSKESQGKSGEQQAKASAIDHLSKGPQIPDSKLTTATGPDGNWPSATDMPPKVSREENEARMKELNKSDN